MATFEERLTAIEREHVELKHDNAALKEKIELQTVAIGGLVNKALLERINEKNDKIFQTLIAHDEFTNRQLSELRERIEVKVEGKIAGIQTEMHQGFEGVNSHFEGVNSHFEGVNSRFEEMNSRFEALEQGMNSRFDEILFLLNTLTNKPDQGTSRQE